MITRRVTVLGVALIAALALALPAAASPPAQVSIEVETSLLGLDSPFEASGPAVDDGLLCETGTVHDDEGAVTGFSPNGFNFHGIKHFVCDDGSGDVRINLQARIDFRRGVSFRWNVLEAHGDYAGLHGAGSGVGLPYCGPDCVLDVYDGGLHIDP